MIVFIHKWSEEKHLKLYEKWIQENKITPVILAPSETKTKGPEPQGAQLLNDFETNPGCVRPYLRKKAIIKNTIVCYYK